MSEHTTGAHPSGSRRLALTLVATALGLVIVWGVFGRDREATRETPLPGSATSLAASAESPPDASRVAAGLRVFEGNSCAACHSIDGTGSVGPDLLGLWGRERVFVDGSSATADEPYFEQAILDPSAQVVEGFDDAMPSYDGLIEPDDLGALIEYLRSLR
jgi:cytochrome c oxidase subunit 2